MKALTRLLGVGLKIAGILSLAAVLTGSARAGVKQYGDEDLCNTGTYPTDPEAGTTLQGLAANAVTISPSFFQHSYPFSPAPGEFPGTDQIYVGSVQTNSHDGYASSSERINGPDVMSLDYSSLVPEGQEIATLTLGIAADDFQFPAFGQPFLATINGVSDSALVGALESLEQTGPYEQFFTIGISPSLLTSNNTLVLSIDEGGDGGDGWAVDFVTVGVTTQAVPEPSTIVVAALGSLGLIGHQLRRKGVRAGASANGAACA